MASLLLYAQLFYEFHWQKHSLSAIFDAYRPSTLDLAVPGFSTSLAYYDTYRRENVPANLIQVAVPGLLVSPASK